MLYINDYISILSIFKLIQGSYRLEYQKCNANLMRKRVYFLAAGKAREAPEKAPYAPCWKTADLDWAKYGADPAGFQRLHPNAADQFRQRLPAAALFCSSFSRLHGEKGENACEYERKPLPHTDCRKPDARTGGCAPQRLPPPEDKGKGTWMRRWNQSRSKKNSPFGGNTDEVIL